MCIMMCRRRDTEHNTSYFVDVQEEHILESFHVEATMQDIPQCNVISLGNIMEPHIDLVRHNTPQHVSFYNENCHNCAVAIGCVILVMNMSANFEAFTGTIIMKTIIRITLNLDGLRLSLFKLLL